MSPQTAAFETVPLEPGFRPATLVSREWLTPGYVRVRFAGPALKGFNAPGADDHVRVFFGPAGEPAPTEAERWRELPSREYTPLASGADWVEFDLLILASAPLRLTSAHGASIPW